MYASRLASCLPQVPFFTSLLGASSESKKQSRSFIYLLIFSHFVYVCMYHVRSTFLNNDHTVVSLQFRRMTLKCAICGGEPDTDTTTVPALLPLCTAAAARNRQAG